MNELLKVDFKNAERPTVSGRGLHAALAVQTPYRLWFPCMCEYGFTEGTDYTPYFFVHPQNNQETEDHQLTIDMAKEIAMLQQTEKGKEVREYFIRVEKEFNSPETMIARALIMASRQLEARDRLIEEMKPKAAFYYKAGWDGSCVAEDADYPAWTGLYRQDGNDRISGRVERRRDEGRVYRANQRI